MGGARGGGGITEVEHAPSGKRKTPSSPGPKAPVDQLKEGKKALAVGRPESLGGSKKKKTRLGSRHVLILGGGPVGKHERGGETQEKNMLTV